MKRAIVAVVLGVLLGFGSYAAEAATTATHTGKPTVSAAKWSVVVSTGAATPTTTGAVSVPTTGPTFLSISNNGTAPLVTSTKVAVRITMTGVGGGTARLEGCTGTWNETANTCSGSVFPIMNSGTTLTVPNGSTYPVGVGQRVRVVPTAAPAGSSITVGASVTA